VTLKVENTDAEDLDAVDGGKNKRAAFKRIRDRSTMTSVILAKLGLEVCMERGW
jgi:hypothetical protein